MLCTCASPTWFIEFKINQHHLTAQSSQVCTVRMRKCHVVLLRKRSTSAILRHSPARWVLCACASTTWCHRGQFQPAPSYGTIQPGVYVLCACANPTWSHTGQDQPTPSYGLIQPDVCTVGMRNSAQYQPAPSKRPNPARCVLCACTSANWSYSGQDHPAPSYCTAQSSQVCNVRMRKCHMVLLRPVLYWLCG